MSRAFDFSQLPKGGVTVLPNPATDIPVAGDVLAYLSTDAKGRILTEWRVGGSGGGGAGTVTSITAGGVLTGGTITTSGTIGLNISTGLINNAGTISNSGVISVGGTTGNVALGTGLVLNTQTIAVRPATTVALGGISVGAGLAVDVNGVLTVTGGTGSGGATIQPTPPAAAAGALWWDNTGGQLYIRYDDGNSQEWVAASAPAGAGGAGFVPSAGGTMTGPLVLSGDATANLNPVPLRQLNTTLTAYALTSTVPPPSSSLPLMDSIAAIGSAANFARADHIHPTDTSRAATSAIPVASVTNPLMDGTVAIGSSLNWAKADHIHPTDTTRYAASNPSGYQTAAQLAAYLPLVGGTLAGPGNVSGTNINLSGNLTAGNVVAAACFAGQPTVTDFNLGIGGNVRALAWRGGVYAMQFDNAIGTLNIIGNSLVTWAIDFGGNVSMPSGNLTLGQGHGYQPGAGPWLGTSDARVKRKVAKYETGLAEVTALEPVSYEYNGQGGTTDDGKTYYGLIAQHTAKVMPELIFTMPSTTDEHGKRTDKLLDGQLGTNLGPLTMALVNAVKTLNTRLAALEQANGA
jgi:hypothetical protein